MCCRKETEPSNCYYANNCYLRTLEKQIHTLFFAYFSFFGYVLWKQAVSKTVFFFACRTWWWNSVNGRTQQKIDECMNFRTQTSILFQRGGRKCSWFLAFRRSIRSRTINTVSTPDTYTQTAVTYKVRRNEKNVNGTRRFLHNFQPLI